MVNMNLSSFGLWVFLAVFLVGFFYLVGTVPIIWHITIWSLFIILGLSGFRLLYIWVKEELKETKTDQRTLDEFK